MSTIDAFLNHLEQRLNINIVQQILRESKLPSARRWSELKGIIKTGVANDPNLIDRLRSALIMHQLCDLKAIAFYEVSPTTATMVEVALKTARISAGPLASTFPIDVDAAVLNADDGMLKVVHKFNDDFGSGIVLSRCRKFTLSHEIASSAFSPELQKRFPDAEKLIEVKSFNKQTYDVIYLNKAHGVLEVRADVTRDSGLQQTAGQLKKSMDDLRVYASGFVSKAQPGYNLGQPLNLLPFTGKVYDDISGAIKKIGFATEEESVKRETMRAGVDLRNEIFHNAGAQAIDRKMSIFEVAIQWHGTDVIGGVSGSRPELYIPGNHRDYTKAGARTDFLFVKGVRTYADSNFIVEKLISYK
ncbi:hypothetical protein [Pseudomonas mosselii]|uniref:hypothetical protein n=1 Tax=Pseudomonas mosselii TaxID=78327 RepID=UPI001F2C5C12|nr:hypothetical protein [Pseudomonas mosselii]